MNLEKICPLLGVLIFVTQSVFGQWDNNGGLNGGTLTTGGSVGIGTSTPGVWFGGAKTFEFVDARPVLKLSSNSSTGLSTLLFTNTNVNGTTHMGEFHVNYIFNPWDNSKSLLRFSSYPANDLFTLQSDGTVGIGTISPRSPLEVCAVGNNNSVQTGLILQQTNPGSPNNAAGISLDFGIGNNGTNNNIEAKITLKETYWSVKPKMFFSLWNENNVMQDRMVIDTYGNVGIGTIDPGSFKLAVNGKIWTQEVNVAMTNPGPDYVFEKDYDLLSLTELETYINQNKHLPEVPSAKEMEANGLNLKEMNLLLLKKVEELTLHILNQQKQIDNQQNQITQLKNKIK